MALNMPMGCSTSCKTFELVSTTLEWVAHKHLKMDYIIHVLDNFLIVAPSFNCVSDNCLILSFFVISLVFPQHQVKLVV